MKAMMDVPHERIIEAYNSIKLKSDVCKILPKARFFIANNGEIIFQGLICDDRMGEKSTGAGAEYCKNCVK